MAGARDTILLDSACARGIEQWSHTRMVIARRAGIPLPYRDLIAGAMSLRCFMDSPVINSGYGNIFFI